MTWRTKIIIITALLLAAFVFLACDEGRDGSCRGPACYSAEGHNP